MTLIELYTVLQDEVLYDAFMYYLNHYTNKKGTIV